jgi:hypothetical protein
MVLNCRSSAKAIVASVAIATSSVAVAMPSSQKICKPNFVSAVGMSIVEQPAKNKAVNFWHGRVTNLYGSPWASWSNAVQKSISCLGNGPPKVTCTATARPCRLKALIHGYEPVQRFDLPEFRTSRRPGRRPMHFRMPRLRKLYRMPNLTRAPVDTRR